MNIEWVRKLCMSLPHTTEKVQWGGDLVFKVGGKMYVVAALEVAAVCMSFECTPEEFAELVELPGVIPAPYLARYHWVGLENEDAIPRAEMKRLIRKSYDLVLEKLPNKARAELGSR
jgi:predicted DNA-binding protein (MmcQ/YjbR family)